MTDPFATHPIYDQLVREQEERDRPPDPPAAEWPADDDPEEPSA